MQSKDDVEREVITVPGLEYTNEDSDATEYEEEFTESEWAVQNVEEKSDDEEEENEDDEGWIYLLSNPAFKKNMVKIGMTKRKPEIRAQELSRHTSVPEPFVVEFAKLVKNPKKREREIHSILEDSHDRPNPSREFFIVPKQFVEKIFKIPDGIDWVRSEVTEEEPKPQLEPVSKTRKAKKKKRRGPNDWKLILHDKQRLRIKIPNRKGDEWMGIYNEENHSIEYNGEEIVAKPGGSPFNKFAVEYRKSNNRHQSVSAWEALECEIDGKWVLVDDVYDTVKKNQN